MVPFEEDGLLFDALGAVIPFGLVAMTQSPDSSQMN